MPNDFFPHSAYVILVEKYKALKERNPGLTQKEFCIENDINYTSFSVYFSRDKRGPNEPPTPRYREEAKRIDDEIPEVRPPSYWEKYLQREMKRAL